MNALKLIFSAKAHFKVVVRSVKIGKAIVFLVNPTILNNWVFAHTYVHSNYIRFNIYLMILML